MEDEMTSNRMKEVDDGGAAFPGKAFSQNGHLTGYTLGMTRRQWLMGQAMANTAICNGDAPDGVLTQWFGLYYGQYRWQIAARQAIEFADAVIAEEAYMADERPDRIEELSQSLHLLRCAAEGLGALPNGYCFCSHDRDGSDAKEHQPECEDLREAIEYARSVSPALGFKPKPAGITREIALEQAARRVTAYGSFASDTHTGPICERVAEIIREMAKAPA